MDKKSHRIELSEDERQALKDLKTFFNRQTMNGVIRHLIILAKNKYLR